MAMQGKATVTRRALTTTQLKKLAIKAQELRRKDDLDKEDALDEAYRQLGFGRKA